MSLSLREQLLAAGLGTKKQAKQAEHQQRQQSRNEASREAERKRQAEAQARQAEAQASKAARDQELNRRRQEQAGLKARWAQIRQLIDEHRLPKIESDDYFNFIDRKKVRRIAIDPERRERLIRGELVIVRCEGRYDVVLAEVAARIGERDQRAVVNLQADSGAGAGEDDPYKDFAVPDDLKW